jgi:hypothetical protein
MSEPKPSKPHAKKNGAGDYGKRRNDNASSAGNAASPTPGSSRIWSESTLDGSENAKPPYVHLSGA